MSTSAESVLDKLISLLQSQAEQNGEPATAELQLQQSLEDKLSKIETANCRLSHAEAKPRTNLAPPLIMDPTPQAGTI
ncbi:GL27039 [Drosophila persimilis]|uniref:GL27039 n=1 Tax=Drosophila persimilis TaxID=7234 RepID=B4H7J7_DROPE|nr:GL27039 [Drosophila persimilis]